MDVTKYFKKSTNNKLDGRALNISIQGSSSSSVLSTAREVKQSSGTARTEIETTSSARKYKKGNSLP